MVWVGSYAIPLIANMPRVPLLARMSLVNGLPAPRHRAVARARAFPRPIVACELRCPTADLMSETYLNSRVVS